MNPMHDWLKDEPPMWFDANGDLRSGLPYILLDEYCPDCHTQMVMVAGVKYCPGCEPVRDWLRESKLQLIRYQLSLRIATGVQIELAVHYGY